MTTQAVCINLMCFSLSLLFLELCEYFIFQEYELYLFALCGYPDQVGFLKVPKSVGALNQLGIFVNLAHSEAVLAQKLLAET